MIFFPPGRNMAIVIDDESYHMLKGDKMRENDGVWTQDIMTCPPEVRFKQKAKFSTKLLVRLSVFGSMTSKLPNLGLIFFQIHSLDNRAS